MADAPFIGSFPGCQDYYGTSQDFYQAIEVFLSSNAPHQHLPQSDYTVAMIQSINSFEKRVLEHRLSWFDKNLTTLSDRQKKIYDRILSRNIVVWEQIADYYPNGRQSCFLCGTVIGSPSKSWLADPVSPVPCHNENCWKEWQRIHG